MEYVKILDMPESMQAEVWGIYQSSFPGFELRDWKTHSRAMTDQRFFSMGITENQKIIGLIFYWKIKKITYIEHFAISKSLRGQNYGTKILEEFCKVHENVVLEIDPPIDEVSKNREHFYNRIGFVTSECSYIHPSYTSENIPHSLLLMAHEKTLSKTDFEVFKEDVFGTVIKYKG